MRRRDFLATAAAVPIAAAATVGTSGCNEPRAAGPAAGPPAGPIAGPLRQFEAPEGVAPAIHFLPPRT